MPYRSEQKIEFCEVCGDVSNSQCSRCARLLCKTHSHNKTSRCSHCEDYFWRLAPNQNEEAITPTQFVTETHDEHRFATGLGLSIVLGFDVCMLSTIAKLPDWGSYVSLCFPLLWITHYLLTLLNIGGSFRRAHFLVRRENFLKENTKRK